ncbi:MAG TPA: hypothetical protein VGG75_40145 [Trebonia sp.]|jgi:hypothetical protein
MGQPARFEDDPDWLRARAVYLDPDANTPDGRLFIRFDAAREMRNIEARYEP